MEFTEDMREVLGLAVGKGFALTSIKEERDMVTFWFRSPEGHSVKSFFQDGQVIRSNTNWELKDPNKDPV